MSILNPTIDPATQAANQIRSIARQQYVQLGASGIRGYNLIWKNRNATPQEVVAALGTDFGPIMALAQLNIATVNSAATICNTTATPIPSIPDGYTVNIDSAGNGTVIESSGSGSGSSSSAS